jgi:hypothetical protein
MPKKKDYTRYRWRALGLCRQCGGVRDSDLVLCSSCRDKQKARDNKAKVSGICVRCKAAQARPGRTYCTECSDKQRNKWHSDAALGVCPRCKNSRSGDSRQCDACNTKASRYRLSKVYGCAAADVDRWLTLSQEGNCEICSKPSSECANRRLSVDHSHTSPPVVRGCLCENCNTLLGHLEKVVDAGGLLRSGELSDNPYLKYLQLRDPRYSALSE